MQIKKETVSKLSSMDSLFFDEKMFSNRSFIDTIPIGNRLNVEFCLYALSCRAFFCLKMKTFLVALALQL